MSEQPAPHPIALEQQRQRVVEQLCERFADEILSEGMLEERLDLAYRASTPADLQALVADLPAVREGGVVAAVTGAETIRPARSADRQTVVAVMGGAERKGVWAPSRELYAFAVMGGVDLDFRQARFAHAVTEITCFAMMGGVEIVVPPGVRVELNGGAFMGGFGQKGGAEATTDPGAPLLRIGGACLMGGVEVQVRLPGETQKEARQRVRLERKRQERLSRGE
ncbi:MAG: DUF1707 domain-containing protein [Gemmatimonadota bacterium]|nr:DUF1707 domain-containing protein [Gemmatimonadota bacterium]